MRLTTLFVLLIVYGIGGCRPTIELPIKRAEIPACGTTSGIVDTVRYLASQNGLQFYWGTHTNQFGRNLQFRLVGRGFEITLFNTFDQDVLEIRVYSKSPDKAVKDRAVATFQNIASAMSSDRSLICPNAAEKSADPSEQQPKPVI